MRKQYYVYILSSFTKILYIGVTDNIIKRVYQHKHDLVEGFTKKYKVHKLVHYEMYDDIIVAISREKNLKRWKREWKIKLIEETNSGWKDLYEDIIK